MTSVAHDTITYPHCGGDVLLSEALQSRIKEDLDHALHARLTEERVEAIAEAFVAMKADLDRERRAVEKIWAAREKQLGHPLAVPEIVDKVTSPYEIIDQLRSRKLIVEGEIGYEISEQAQSARLTVKFKPREGLVSKLVNRFSIKLDLKDLFGSSG
jgi:hypothetical protein